MIAAGSDLIGRSAATMHLRERYGVNVLAIGRRGRLRSTRLQQTRFKLGDAIVLQGHTSQLPDILAALGCLPLAERTLNLGRKRQHYHAAGDPRGGDRHYRLRAGAGARDRLCRRGAGAGAARLCDVEGGLHRGRMADPHADRRADPDRRGGAPQRHRQGDRDPARRRMSGICRTVPCLRRCWRRRCW